MALMLMAASPAFVHDAVAVDYSVAQGGEVLLFGDAQQFAFAAQGQFGDALADDDGVTVVASDQGITINQANGGFDDGFFFVD